MGVYEEIFSANFEVNNMDDIKYMKSILNNYGRNNPSRRITLGSRIFSKMGFLDVFEYEYVSDGYREHVFFNGIEVFVNPDLNPYAFVVSVIHDDNPIKRVIFNNPATIVIWKDGSKTVLTVMFQIIYLKM